jgi:hypothetical protein
MFMEHFADTLADVFGAALMKDEDRRTGSAEGAAQQSRDA